MDDASSREILLWHYICLPDDGSAHVWEPPDAHEVCLPPEARLPLAEDAGVGIDGLVPGKRERRTARNVTR